MSLSTRTATARSLKKIIVSWEVLVSQITSFHIKSSWWAIFIFIIWSLFCNKLLKWAYRATSWTSSYWCCVRIFKNWWILASWGRMIWHYRTFSIILAIYSPQLICILSNLICLSLRDIHSFCFLLGYWDSFHSTVLTHNAVSSDCIINLFLYRFLKIFSLRTPTLSSKVADSEVTEWDIVLKDKEDPWL